MASEHILVVDDDAGGRYLKAHILRRAGFDVAEADTGKKALNLTRGGAYALVLLDVQLPDISGLDVCAQIKAFDPSILVLQTSAAFTGGADRAAGLAGGADAYMVEPIEPEELQATAEALLRRRRAEDALRQEHADLSRKVAAHDQALAGMGARLRQEIDQRTYAEAALRHAQKLDVLGQLTGGIAHDFNNVLAIVFGNLESMRRQLAKPAPDLGKLQTFTDQAILGAKRALGVTRQLLAFSRRQALSPEVIDINTTVTNLVSMLKQVIGERIELETKLEPGTWPVNVDPDQLETAILNLCLNARDAMPENGCISIETRNVTDGGADLVSLAVGDTGIGMGEEVLRQAFEPFFTTKDVGAGTGLGLSQVHGFVNQSGGRVIIESGIGRGTKVTLLIPRHAGPIPAAEPAAPAAAAHSGRDRCILVVEDDDPVRQHTIGALQEMGYRVVDAGSGREALALLDKHADISLLFTDIGLPGGMSGPHLARAALERRPELKVLYTTAYATDRLEAEGLTSADAIVSKPFTYESLAHKLAALLDAETERPRILVIEDEAMIRLDLVDSLQELGFDAVEAVSLADAERHLQEGAPSLSAIVTDIGLPDGRGDDFAGKIRTRCPDVPVIVATGYTDPRMREKFRDDPKVAVVAKPYYPEQIVATLRKLGMRTP